MGHRVPVRQTHYNKNPDYVNGAERKWSRNRVGTGSSPWRPSFLPSVWALAWRAGHSIRTALRCARRAPSPHRRSLPCRPSRRLPLRQRNRRQRRRRPQRSRPRSRGPLDLNRATAQELTTLPGIGEVLAQRIVDYREAHGPFRSVEELIAVEGIGEGKLEKLRELVTVEVEP